MKAKSPMQLRNDKAVAEAKAEHTERYRIAAPVWFKWQTSSGSWREGRGTTRYLNDREVLVLAYPVPVPGSSIALRVEIPTMGRLARPLVMRGEGTVTRVEPEIGQPIGFHVSVSLDDEDRCSPDEAGSTTIHSRSFAAHDCRHLEDAPDRDSSSWVPERRKQ